MHLGNMPLLSASIRCLYYVFICYIIPYVPHVELLGSSYDRLSETTSIFIKAAP